MDLCVYVYVHVHVYVYVYVYVCVYWCVRACVCVCANPIAGNIGAYARSWLDPSASTCSARKAYQHSAGFMRGFMPTHFLLPSEAGSI